eukprot:gene1280-735_t
MRDGAVALALVSSPLFSLSLPPLRFRNRCRLLAETRPQRVRPFPLRSVACLSRSTNTRQPLWAFSKEDRSALAPTALVDKNEALERMSKRQRDEKDVREEVERAVRLVCGPPWPESAEALVCGPPRPVHVLSLTPLERQVVALKESLPPHVVLMVACGYRVKFYGRDSRVASRRTGIMCIPAEPFEYSSVPYVRVDLYIHRLVEMGYHVAFADQESAAVRAAEGTKSGIFIRSVSQLYSRGTLLPGEKVRTIGQMGAEAARTAPSSASGKRGDEKAEEDEAVAEEVEDAPPAPPHAAAPSAELMMLFLECRDALLRLVLVSFVTHRRVMLELDPSNTLAFEDVLQRYELAEVVLLDAAHPSPGCQPQTPSERLRLLPENIAGLLQRLLPLQLGPTATGEEDGGRVSVATGQALPSTDDAIEAYLQPYKLDAVYRQLATEAANVSSSTAVGRSAAVPPPSETAAEETFVLPGSTLRALEVFHSSSGPSCSLFHLLNHTATAAGARRLREWVAAPLVRRAAVLERQAAVTFFAGGLDGGVAADLLREASRGAGGDMEAIAAKIHAQRCSVREFIGLLKALQAIGMLATQLTEEAEALPAVLARLLEALRQPPLMAWLEANRALLQSTASTPLELFAAGELPGPAPASVQQHLEEAQAAERCLHEELMAARSQLKLPSLEYRTIAGTPFLLDVPQTAAALAPRDWIVLTRTKSNVRFHTPGIVEANVALCAARERMAGASRDAWASFQECFYATGEQMPLIRHAIQAVAAVDALHSLSVASRRQGYVAPVIQSDEEEHGAAQIDIRQGRHPVADEVLRHQYVACDVTLRRRHTFLLTGPNMGGKSAFMRMVGVFVILSQIGCYVPAEAAALPIFRGVLCRMGAGDSVLEGRSTFMSEMEETSRILRHPTGLARSLVLMDELGRGTSSFDGMAVAAATLDYLVQLGATALFVTHYTSLCEPYVGADGSAAAPGRVECYFMGFREEIAEEETRADGGLFPAYSVHLPADPRRGAVFIWRGGGQDGWHAPERYQRGGTTACQGGAYVPVDERHQLDIQPTPVGTFAEGARPLAPRPPSLPSMPAETIFCLNEKPKGENCPDALSTSSLQRSFSPSSFFFVADTMQRSRTCLASLRYRRPYWMLFLHGVDNWRIYTVIQQPEHQRTEMLYQAWLGGLDRPYVRPKCMAHQPVWLTKKRQLLRKSRLQGAQTHLEKYVLEWEQRFHCFEGTVRPTPEDLHSALDLVERPLDLSYAVQLLNQCRNHFNIRFHQDTFVIFMEACLRVDRKDCAVYALENRETLGFWHVDEDCERFLKGEQSWYKRSLVDHLYYPLKGNEALNAAAQAAPGEQAVPGVDMDLNKAARTPPVAADTDAVPAAAAGDELSELERLEAELKALEEEEARLNAELNGDGATKSGSSAIPTDGGATLRVRQPNVIESPRSALLHLPLLLRLPHPSLVSLFRLGSNDSRDSSPLASMWSVALTQCVEAIVPDSAEEALVRLGQHTGMRWGPSTHRQYWFQPPKVHLFLFVVMNFLMAGFLHHISRGFRGRALGRVGAVCARSSLQSRLNTVLSVLLMSCLAANAVAKLDRPHPWIQVGWLLMPCHLMSATWAYLLMRQSREAYPNSCYLATLMLDWSWAPLLAVAYPDCSDHRHRWESYVFALQHALLLILPVYYAARYHTLGLHWKHVCHFTWIPIVINFGVYTPYALLTGLNLNYMLYPPVAAWSQRLFVNEWYRAVMVPLLIVCSTALNKTVRRMSSFIRTTYYPEELKRGEARCPHHHHDPLIPFAAPHIRSTSALKPRHHSTGDVWTDEKRALRDGKEGTALQQGLSHVYYG